MVEFIKLELNLYTIKSIIVSKTNGFEGPGAFVFKNGDNALFVGYSSDLSKYLNSKEFESYIPVYRFHSEGVKYTHIEQYLTQNNYLAASLADLLRENFRPTDNKEDFIKSRWDIRGMCEEYEKAHSEEKYNIARHLSSSIGEERIENYKQQTIDEAWGVDDEK